MADKLTIEDRIKALGIEQTKVEVSPTVMRKILESHRDELKSLIVDIRTRIVRRVEAGEPAKNLEPVVDVCEKNLKMLASIEKEIEGLGK